MTDRLMEVVNFLRNTYNGTHSLSTYEIYVSSCENSQEKDLIRFYDQNGIQVDFCPSWEYVRITGLTCDECYELKLLVPYLMIPEKEEN